METQKEKGRKSKPIKLYTKLVISYLFIVIMSVLTLYVAISEINVRSIQKQAIEHNRAMLLSVSEEYKQKCKNLKNAVVRLYMDSLTSSTKADIWKILEDDIDMMEYKECKTSALTYLRESSLDEDSNLLAASIYRVDDSIIITETNSPFYFDKLIIENIDKDNYDKTKRIHFIGTIEGGYDKLVILYYQLLDRNNYNDVIGYMAYCYAPEAIKNAYSSYEDTKIGDILIISDRGDVLFDSSGKNYGNTFSEMDILLNNKNSIVYTKDSIMNVIYQPDYGYYVVGIMEEKDFSEINSPARNIMLISIVIFSVLAGIFSLIISKNMTARTSKLIVTMEQVKKGDLSARANIKGNDEIKALGDYFDDTCMALENHINREYIAQMKQKEAQIYALQNQINPHFLYNALESVRMKAVMNDDEDVGQMIVYLADIFRNNIKSNMVIMLQQEIENCKSFFEFYNIRYDYRVELIYAIDNKFMKCGIMRHMLQPILENAVVHGIDLSKMDNEIEIYVTGDGDYLEIQVSDNGKGMKKEVLEELQEGLSNHQDSRKDTFVSRSGNLGLVNVNERIKLVYGSDCGITVSSIQGEGTLVKVKIRQMTVEELERNVKGIVS